jgi:hypothetical protein
MLTISGEASRRLSAGAYASSTSVPLISEVLTPASNRATRLVELHPILPGERIAPGRLSLHLGLSDLRTKRQVAAGTRSAFIPVASRSSCI